MKTLTYTDSSLDQSSWPAGPWDDEPDKIQWPDPITGLPCLINRNHSGAWCGYVGVAEGHPLFEVHYNDAPDVDVHGGLTFSNFCSPEANDLGICHVPEPGEPDRVWWLGFDCNHYMDVAPGMHFITPLPNETYRDVAYVTAEVTSLAAQIAVVAP